MTDHPHHPLAAVDIIPPTRKKLNITLPKYEPEPEKPPRECRLCLETRPEWYFDKVYHKDICHHCVFFPMPHVKETHRTDLTQQDRGMVLSAEAVIRRLRNASRR